VIGRYFCSDDVISGFQPQTYNNNLLPDNDYDYNYDMLSALCTLLQCCEAAT